MKIKHIDRSDFPRWEQYVAKHAGSTFYHKIEWKEVIEKSFGHKTYYLLAMEGDNAVGILPLVHLNSFLFGSILCSMPFLNFGGICSENEEAERALLKEATRILHEVKGDYLELRHLKPSAAHLPNKSHKVSMTVELDPDPEVLWNKFKGKHRTNIRKAVKNGLEIRVGNKEFLKDLYNILSIGWRDLGTPIYPISFFENILNAFGNSLQIYVVVYRGKPIAAAFNGLFRDTVEGMWLYSLREYSKLQTNYFLYWEMIKRACQEGYKHFHLGRSTTESGGTFFKTKWNAIPKQLYWEYVLNGSGKLPELNVDNPKYEKAINLWRKLPVRITQLVGPYIAKNIP